MDWGKQQWESALLQQSIDGVRADNEPVENIFRRIKYVNIDERRYDENRDEEEFCLV